MAKKNKKLSDKRDFVGIVDTFIRIIMVFDRDDDRLEQVSL